MPSGPLARQPRSSRSLEAAFYFGLLEVGGKDPLHIFNGFVMTMRSKPTKPSTEIYHYSVEWEPSKLSWSTLAAGSSGLPTLPSPRRTLCEA